MGSYNMSCSLSGLSIGPGDPAVVILMESAQIGDNTDLVISPREYIYPSEGVTSCVVLPIKGTYADYGDLEWTAKNNPHLEHMAGDHNIEALLHPYHDSEPTENDKEHFPEGLFAVWIHGEVWEKMIAWMRSKPFENGTVWTYRTLLTALGFRDSGEVLEPGEDKDPHGRGRYKYLWVKDDWPNIAIGMDGSYFSKLWVKDKAGNWVAGPYTCTFKDILAYARRRRLPLDWELVKHKVSELHVMDMVDEAGKDAAWEKIAYERAVRNLEEDNYQDSSILSAEQLKAYDLKRVAAGPYRYAHHNWAWLAGGRAWGVRSFTRLWGQALRDKEPSVVSATAELQDIQNAFFNCGRLMIPTHGGPQCGEPSYTHRLALIMQRTSAQELKERSY